MSIADFDAELSRASAEAADRNYDSAQRHISLALEAVNGDSQKRLKILELKASLFELQNAPSKAADAWKDCIRLTEGPEGTTTERSAKYALSAVRELRASGDNAEAERIFNRVKAFEFEKENVDGENANGRITQFATARTPDNSGCPTCGFGDAVVPIVYGKPTDALIAREAIGEIRLGGNLPTGNHHYCTRCQTCW